MKIYASKLNRSSLSEHLIEQNTHKAKLLETKHLPSDTLLLEKNQLNPGDILFMHHDNTFTAHVIALGQKLPQFFNPRRADPITNYIPTKKEFVHVALWIKSLKHSLEKDLPNSDEPEVTEAKNGYAVINTSLIEGHYSVYRSHSEHLAKRTAEVAKAWGQDRHIRYKYLKALASILRYSACGKSARKIQERFKNTSNAKHPSSMNSGAICSEVVLAAYQNAATQLHLPLGSALNAASHTVSPCLLQHLIAKDRKAFHSLGEIIIEPEDVLYRELRPGEAIKFAAKNVSALAVSGYKQMTTYIP